MPQWDKFGSLKRMAFSYNGKTIQLAVNPQNYEFNEPQRITSIKTQTDNIVEQYGPDFPTITISGNLGYRAINGKTGTQRFNELRDMILQYQASTVDGAYPATDMYFYNYTDDQSYTVTIAQGGFQYTRSVDTTLLYNYSIAMIVLRGSDQPNRGQVVNPITGTGSGSSNKSSNAAQGKSTSYVTSQGTAKADTTRGLKYIDSLISVSK